ncbi:uncharacterized protein P884DRAFT_208294 [Thermothelomyces heterothallicus CBS 202.75]|uniref:uncharacterized protein n=1 Tax=Thermothelomyces heterothallicus CBS 202.75 TaxID=1149848 RepID=UPI003742B221
MTLTIIGSHPPAVSSSLSEASLSAVVGGGGGGGGGGGLGLLGLVPKRHASIITHNDEKTTGASHRRLSPFLLVRRRCGAGTGLILTYTTRCRGQKRQRWR